MLKISFYSVWTFLLLCLVLFVSFPILAHAELITVPTANVPAIKHKLNWGTPLKGALEPGDLVDAGCQPIKEVAAGQWQYEKEFIRIETAGGDTNIVCPPEAIEYFKQAGFIDTGELDAIQQSVIWLINFILTFLGQIGLWVLLFSTYLFTILLGFNTFISHGFVQTGWPFLQGIANLGFIIALLFIAAGTTLQLGEKFSAKKMLPRLLGAALLINFSLVIAGAVIDLSRLLMAVEVVMLNNGGGIETLATDILVRSPILSGIYNATSNTLTSPGTHSWAVPLQLFQVSLLIWTLTIGMLFIAFGLFVRWVALVILLIFSPLPYLSIAFPKMDKYWDQWWQYFLKWVFYGPILIFFILLISSVGDILPQEAPNENKPNINAWVTVGNTVILGVLLYLASKSSALLGGGGADGVMKVAQSWGRRAVYGASGAALGVAAARLTGRAAGNVRDAAYYRARDFASEVTKPAREVLKTGEFALYDDKGKPKKGKESIGAKWGKNVRRSAPGVVGGVVGGTTGAVVGGILGGPVGAAVGAATGGAFGARNLGSTKQDTLRAKEIEDTKNTLAATGPAISAANVGEVAFSSSRLKKAHVLSALGGEVNNVLKFGEASQVKAIAQNKDYLRKFADDAGKIADIEDAIRKNTTITSLSEKEKAIEQLNKALDEIAAE